MVEYTPGYYDPELIKQESRNDPTLVRLIGRRETIFREVSFLMRNGQSSDTESLRREMEDVAHGITTRKLILEEWWERAGGNEDYFHQLVSVDDARRAAEDDPEDAQAVERLRAAKEELAAYEHRHGLFSEPPET